MRLINFGKTFLLTLLFLLVIEGLSIAGWSWPLAGKIIFWLIVACTFLLSWMRLDLAFCVVLAELLVGSKGYLFSYDIGNFTVSLRLGLFLAIFSVWFIHYFLKRQVSFRQSKLFWWFTAFFLVYLGAVINSLARNYPLKNVFLDANGYLYFGLIFVFYEVFADQEKIRRGLEVFFAGLIIFALKTLTLLIIFSAQPDFISLVYRWARDTRVEEITFVAQNFYRIFSQSHFYSLVGAILIITLLALKSRAEWQKRYRFLVIALTCSTVSLLISYSRSFWLSFILTAIVMLVVFVKRYRFSFRRVFKFSLALIGLLTLEAVLIVLLVSLPTWLTTGQPGTSLASLIEERIGDSQEPALQSRWSLLKPLTKEIISSPVIGKGFASEVTYVSSDPRLVASSGGIYRTYGFEWGYLDIMLKMGLIGLAVYGLFLWQLGKLGLMAYKKCSSEQQIIVLGLLFGLLALIISHATTPYLNHPLGIGYLLLCAAVFERFHHGSSITSFATKS